MKYIFTIFAIAIFTLSCTEIAAAQDDALTVQGVSIGMPDDAVKAQFGIQNEDWAAMPAAQSRGAESESVYESENEQRLTISYSGLAQNKTVSAVRYDYGLIQAQGESLEMSLTRRFGAPAAKYTLNEDAALLVWERPAPTSGKELGRLITVALQTGPQGSLTLSRFDRPDIITASPAQPNTPPVLPRGAAFGQGATD